MPTTSLLLTFLFLLFQAPEPFFQVKVNGEPIQLHDFQSGSFGQFEIVQPADVEVRVPFYVRWVDIRPKSAGIVPIIAGDHSSVRFQVQRPVPLTVEFNGDWNRVIHLFANPPEKDPPKQDTANVRYFGPGTHEPGLIELEDGETLYLAPGSWVKGIVRSIGTKNVVIRGRGVLDASGLPRRGRTARNAPTQATKPAVSYGTGRRNMIYLEKTEGARVEGITLVNSQTWTLYARRTRGTHIDGVKILNFDANCGTDGIDIVSSGDVLVENIFVRTNDDCVVVKSRDNEDFNIVHPRNDVSNVTVRRAVLWNMPCGNAVEIGFELRASKVEKIRFEDIDIIRVERGSAISIHNADAAIVQDVVYDNIRVEDARHKLIDFAVLFAQYGVDRPYAELPWGHPKFREEARRRMDRGGAWDGVLRYPPEEHAERAKYRGHIRNIRVNNLSIIDGALPFSILSGFDKNHAVENVVIQDMKYLGRPIRNAAEGKFSIDNARGVEFR